MEKSRVVSLAIRFCLLLACGFKNEKLECYQGIPQDRRDMVVVLLSFLGCVLPPGHRHFHDPGGGDQENPQRRVSVLPLQPRPLVSSETRRPNSPPPRPLDRRFTATKPPERLEKQVLTTTDQPCDRVRVTPTHSDVFHPEPNIPRLL